MKRKTLKVLISLSLAILFLFSACAPSVAPENNNSSSFENEVSLSEIPDYSGNAYVIINSNKPSFTEDEITTKAYEKYYELDNLGRCSLTIACIGKELMPTEDRGSIGQVKPTGWHTVKYDFVDGKYLYNRCHLIGFQLTGENANDQNLITGTRYLNIEGMLPFENMVADYIKETENHVMYRVTPIFEGDNLLASGVQMEGYSVEDNGEGISFNVYCYNVQPGVNIDYKTGESSLGEINNENSSQMNDNEKYVLNTNSKKIHKPSCSSVSKIADSNKQETTENIDNLLSAGYSKCGSCFK
ncbi:MAG: DNA/RNA non-specific endonuclease [Oscillospiraceae bacterium]|nr:DNA/RNA non-specific endonuclease [Oscillospiraceae bacterium]